MLKFLKKKKKFSHLDTQYIDRNYIDDFLPRLLPKY